MHGLRTRAGERSQCKHLTREVAATAFNWVRPDLQPPVTSAPSVAVSQVVHIAKVRTRTESSEGSPLSSEAAISDVHMAVTGISRPQAVVQCVLLFPSRDSAALDTATMVMLSHAEVPVIASAELYAELKGPTTGSHALVLLDSGANAIRFSSLMPSCVSIGFDDMLRTTAALALQMAFPMLTVPVNWEIPSAPAKSVVAARATPAWARLKRMLSWWQKSDEVQRVPYVRAPQGSVGSDTGVHATLVPLGGTTSIDLAAAKPLALATGSVCVGGLAAAHQKANGPGNLSGVIPKAPAVGPAGTGGVESAAAGCKSSRIASTAAAPLKPTSSSKSVIIVAGASRKIPVVPSQAELDRIAAASTCPATVTDTSTPYLASWVPETTAQDWFPGAASLGLPSHKVYLRPVQMPWSDAASLIELSRKMRECLAKYRARGNRAAREKKRRLLASMGMETRRHGAGRGMSGAGDEANDGYDSVADKAEGIVVTDTTGLPLPSAVAAPGLAPPGSGGPASMLWRSPGALPSSAAGSESWRRASRESDRVGGPTQTVTVDTAGSIAPSRRSDVSSAGPHG